MRQRANVEDQVGDPDDHQPDIGIPFGLGIFLGLGHAEKIARHGNQTEEVETEQHKPGRELPCKTGARGSLNHMVGRRDQCIAAEPKYDTGSMSGADSSKACPGCIKIQAWPGKLGGGPNADEHSEDRPGES
ncbi:hypothetical protein D3C87_1765670 [compost metagenome]